MMALPVAKDILIPTLPVDKIQKDIPSRATLVNGLGTHAQDYKGRYKSVACLGGHNLEGETHTSTKMSVRTNHLRICGQSGMEIL